MKHESQKQLKTIPLTAAGLAAAQASAAALSKANSRESSPPRTKGEAARSPVSAAVEPARRKVSRGTTVTLAAIGVLAIACAGAGWTQRNNKTVVAQTGTTSAPAVKEATPAAQPPTAETAVGFVVAARPTSAPTEGAAPAEVKTEAKVEAAPAAPPTGMPAPVVEAAPEAAAPTKRVTMRPRVVSEPAPKADPPAPREPKAKPPEKTASAAPPEAPKPAPAAAPSSVDAILQQQLKSAIP